MIANLSYEEYAAIWALRSSLAKSALVSPLQFLHDLRTPAPDQPFYLLGRALHAFILEPESFLDRFAIFRDAKSRNAKSYKEFAAADEQLGKSVLLGAEWDRVQGMVQGLFRNPQVVDVLASGVTEQTLTWIDERTGLPCKARVDLVNGCLADLKSTSYLVPSEFSRQIARRGYHFSLAFYDAGCRANGIELAADPKLIAVDSSPPHDSIVYSLEYSALELGRQQVREALAVVKHARDRGLWPGQAPDEVVPIDLPRWAYPEEPDDFIVGGEVVSL